ncbi:U3 small nucleolar RNA-associated protein 6 homolog [Polyodon spathula]|uniref:U3 small nucleolar RNA-associated protein 6 homolog n=1 Tax=Polyodon spathula TaxID=7913 RepID=UPI001B7F5028|nr:U3 small nucleolar RNA-associated protein 6 homolog [Polyodon spathula]XP_041076578.1 U3 small nucleolar RNA-associated protein 6 homolog [Polyodon spathula]XP_041076579.1 U3 small nucleolar RNA-associated protein 6 homolog [Polyodon spathula]
MQEEILQDLQSLHADDPLMWDFMAKREREAESLPTPDSESKQTKALEVGRQEERCCAVYEEAVTAVPTGVLQDAEPAGILRASSVGVRV